MHAFSRFPTIFANHKLHAITAVGQFSGHRHTVRTFVRVAVRQGTFVVYRHTYTTFCLFVCLSQIQKDHFLVRLSFLLSHHAQQRFSWLDDSSKENAKERSTTGIQCSRIVLAHKAPQNKKGLRWLLRYGGFVSPLPTFCGALPWLRSQSTHTIHCRVGRLPRCLLYARASRLASSLLISLTFQLFGN